MSEHFPTPWVAERNAYGTWFIYRVEKTETAPTGLKYRQLVSGGDGYRTLTSANAAFIVKAVNNHDALVLALENLQAAETAYRMIYDLDGYYHQNTLQARAALRCAGSRARDVLAVVGEVPK